MALTLTTSVPNPLIERVILLGELLDGKWWITDLIVLFNLGSK